MRTFTRGAKAEAARKENVARSTITRQVQKGNDSAVLRVESERTIQNLKAEITKENNNDRATA